jgi:hypothetical protein
VHNLDAARLNLCKTGRRGSPKALETAVPVPRGQKDLTFATDNRLSVSELGPQNYEHTNGGLPAPEFTFYFLIL